MSCQGANAQPGQRCPDCKMFHPFNEVTSKVIPPGRAGDMKSPALMMNALLTQKVEDERLRDLNGLESRHADFLAAYAASSSPGVHDRTREELIQCSNAHAERSAIYNELLSARTALRMHEEADKHVFKAVFSTFSRARTVFIRATTMEEAKRIAQVIEGVYRKARPGAIATIQHLIMTNGVQTPTPELTLEEAILWALNQE